MDFEYFYEHRNQINTLELYVRNLPEWVDNDFLIEFFDRWAEVKSTKIMKTPRNGSLSAMVKFCDFNDMMTTLKQSNKSFIGGQMINVEFSKQAVICCNFCYRFGHLMESCELMKKKRQFKNQKFRENDRWVNSRDKSHSFTGEFYSKQDRSKSPFRNQTHDSKRKWSPRPYEERYDQKRYYTKNTRKNNEKSQSKFHTYYDQEDSMVETNYGSEMDGKNGSEIDGKKYRGRKQEESVESEQELEFVRIINTNGNEQGWITPEDELKMNRLEREGFFSGTSKFDIQFVRIVRQKGSEVQIEY